MRIEYEGLINVWMKKNPITISPEASFYEARSIIRDKGVRHLPVVDKNDHLIGLVTDTDIREAGPSNASELSVHELHYLFGKIKVSSFMTPREKLVTITSDMTIEEAVQLMHDHKIGCLPVMDGEKLAGIITETDVLAIFTDIFGLKLKGTRITIALEDAPGKMLGALEVMKNHNVNIISIVSPTYLVKGKRVAAIRINTDDYGLVVKELEERGYEVLSTDKWSHKA